MALPQGIGDDDLVGAGLAELDVVLDQGGRVGAREGGLVKEPLVAQGRAAAHDHSQSGGVPNHNRGVGGAGDNSRRGRRGHLQDRGGAGAPGRGVRNHAHEGRVGVADARAGQGQDRSGRAGEPGVIAHSRAVPEPLIGDSRPAGGDGEGHRGPIGHAGVGGLDGKEGRLARQGAGGLRVGGGHDDVINGHHTEAGRLPECKGRGGGDGGRVRGREGQVRLGGGVDTHGALGVGGVEVVTNDDLVGDVERQIAADFVGDAF